MFGNRQRIELLVLLLLSFNHQHEFALMRKFGQVTQRSADHLFKLFGHFADKRAFAISQRFPEIGNNRIDVAERQVKYKRCVHVAIFAYYPFSFRFFIGQKSDKQKLFGGQTA